MDKPKTNNTANIYNEIFTKRIRAGRRTYFFDVKINRNKDHYITITESKKTFDDNGEFKLEKYKIFLNKEDFDKFTDGLADAIEFIKNNNSTEHTETNNDTTDSN